MNNQLVIFDEITNADGWMQAQVRHRRSATQWTMKQ